MSCLAWSCLVAAAATAATAAGSAGPAAAVAAAYLPTTGPSCVRHKGHTQQSSLAGRSGWQQPCVLDTLALSGIVWTASVLAPVSLVGRFTLTVVVVKFASHCVFQQNHST